MLWQLSIKNLAIIDDITIEFGDGFNVLTGETGAGKSIIIDAIGLILGGRADRDMIRSGENAAAVDAIFEIDENQALIDKLKESDCYDEYEPQLLISRANICKWKKCKPHKWETCYDWLFTGYFAIFN